MTETMKVSKTITAEEFDEKFDNGEDISDYLDLENARVSLRILINIKLQKKLSVKATKQNKSVEELIVSILESAES